MPIDTSMYGNSTALSDGFEKGMRLGQAFKDGQQRNEEQKKKQTIESAFAKAMKQNPDGSMSLDQNAVVKEIGGAGYGSDAYELQNNFKKQAVENDALKWNQIKQKNEMTGQLLNGVQDQASYDMAKAQAQKYGMDVSQLPPQYDPNFINQAKQQVLTVQQQLANQFQKEQAEYGKTKDDRDEKYRYADLASRSADRKEARDERRFNAGVLREEKVQSLQTPYGLANTPDDAKQVKEAFESKKNFDSKIEQMIALREKHGGGALMNREDVARGKQLSKDALLEYKNMAKLGVLSQSDEAIINAIIPSDVLEYNSPLASMQGQDPILNNLRSFKADKDVDFQNRIKTRTRAGVKTAADVTPNDGMLDMVDSKGGKFKVPASQKAEAIASGLSMAGKGG